MKLFKNGVGRPSNETLRKRKMFYSTLVIVVLLLIVGGFYFINNKLLNKNIESNNKNIGSGSVSLTATDASGKTYKSGTWATKVKLVAGKPKTSGVLFGYTWYKDNKEYSSCKSSTCTISTGQKGTFKVKVRIERKVYYSSTINVKVDPNKVNSIKVKYQYGYLSATVDPYTTSSGYKYQWYSVNSNGSLTAVKGQTSALLSSNSSYGTYKVKVTMGNGSSKTSGAIDFWDIKISKPAYMCRWYYDNITLTYKSYGPVKSFKWLKNGNEYTACKGKTKCTITSNQKANYCVKATSKNGSVLQKCETVEIDKNKFSATLYANNKKIATFGKDWNITVKSGTKLTIKTSGSLLCSQYEKKTYSYSWYGPWKNNKATQASSSQSYTPKSKGKYDIGISSCNCRNYILHITAQ